MGVVTQGVLEHHPGGATVPGEAIEAVKAIAVTASGFLGQPSSPGQSRVFSGRGRVGLECKNAKFSTFGAQVCLSPAKAA